MTLPVIIEARNVNEALPQGIDLLLEEGVVSSSRNGEVLVYPKPVLTVYSNPWERVLSYAWRDANPFFHLYEALWMLAGHDDVERVAQFVPRMRNFSDDNFTLRGAYGRRWRTWFGMDQIHCVGNMLKKDPTTRRAVISMWDPGQDLGTNSKDIPCNTQVYFSVQNGRLDTTVTCRSNDAIWGAYGANAVHFSFLHEYVAALAELPMGSMMQLSNNFHAYTKVLSQVTDRMETTPNSVSHVYPTRDHIPVVGGESAETFMQECRMLLDDEAVPIGARSAWLRMVAVPMLQAHKAYRQRNNPNRISDALDIIRNCAAQDWREAAHSWLERRA